MAEAADIPLEGTAATATNPSSVPPQFAFCPYHFRLDGNDPLAAAPRWGECWVQEL